MENDSNTLRERVYAFFEQPTSVSARIFRVFIILLIIYSGGSVLIEFFYPSTAEDHALIFERMEILVVSIFSLEYILRLWASSSRVRFITNFYNVIDLIAILPIFLSGLNLGFVRIARFARFARALRIIRMAKIMRLLWQTSTPNTSRIVQENVLKNILIIIGILTIHGPLVIFLESVNKDALGDVMFATSILALAAMFGFFALSYGDFNPKEALQRFLIHLTTGFLLFPIGVMFLIIQIILSLQIAATPFIIIFGIWFVYTSVVLWDFANVLRLRKKCHSL